MNRFWIIIFYFFIDRSLSGIYYLQHDVIINQAYTFLGKIVGLFFFLKVLMDSRKKTVDISQFVLLGLLSATMFLPTLIFGGSINRWLQAFYPIMCMIPFIMYNATSIARFRYFVDTISKLYLAVASINLVLILIFPYMYSESNDIWGVQTYFLGGENMVQHPLMIGLLFNYINRELSNSKRQFVFYILIQAITTFVIFSGTSIIGFVICVGSIFLGSVAKFINKIRTTTVLAFAAIVFFFVVVLGGTGIFESAYLAPILDILGKDATLSGRTHVWIVAMMKFMEHPIIGNGFAESVNIFDVWGTNANGVSGYSTLSAHNEFLQKMVEGGIASMTVFGLFLYHAARAIDQLPEKYAIVFKTTLIAFIVLLMSEAAGLYNIFLVCSMAIIIRYNKSINLNY